MNPLILFVSGVFFFFSVREGWNQESLWEGYKLNVKRRVYACYDDMKYEGFFKKVYLRIGMKFISEERGEREKV